MTRRGGALIIKQNVTFRTMVRSGGRGCRAQDMELADIVERAHHVEDVYATPGWSLCFAQVQMCCITVHMYICACVPHLDHTVAVPLPSRYRTVAVPLPYRYRAVTVPLLYCYRTISIPDRYRTVSYHTFTAPLPYRTVTVSYRIIQYHTIPTPYRLPYLSGRTIHEHDTAEPIRCSRQPPGGVKTKTRHPAPPILQPSIPAQHERGRGFFSGVPVLAPASSPSAVVVGGFLSPPSETHEAENPVDRPDG